MSDESIATTATIIGWAKDPSNARAWEEFAARYRARIFQKCYAKLRNHADADDVANAIIIKIRLNIEKFDPKLGKFRQWLSTVTSHACIDFFRSRARRGETVEAGLDEIATSSDPVQEIIDELEHQNESETLRMAMESVRGQVKSRDWEIFYGMTFGDLKAKHFADKYGMTQAAVFKVNQRVKDAIKASVRELGGMMDVEGGTNE